MSRNSKSLQKFRIESVMLNFGGDWFYRFSDEGALLLNVVLIKVVLRKFMTEGKCDVSEVLTSFIKLQFWEGEKASEYGKAFNSIICLTRYVSFIFTCSRVANKYLFTSAFLFLGRNSSATKIFLLIFPIILLAKWVSTFQTISALSFDLDIGQQKYTDSIIKKLINLYIINGTIKTK